MTPILISTEWNDREVETLVDEAIASGRTKVKASHMKLGPYNGYLVPDRKPLFFKKHLQPPLGAGALNFIFRTWSERLRRRYAE